MASNLLNIVKEKHVALMLILLGTVIAAAGFLFQGSSEKVRLDVVKTVKGEDAVEMVKSIHLGNFDIKSAVIVDFKGAGDIRVWIAFAENDSVAYELAEKMKEKVHLYFSSPVDVEFNGLKTYRVFGNGRTHYFFSFQDQVVWIEFSNPDQDYHALVIDHLFGKGEMEKYIK